MLPNHASLKVAESFKMLEALHPGRIDLGLGRAPGTDPSTAAALRGPVQALRADDFPEKLEELMALGQGAIRYREAGPTVAAQPSDVALPPIWLLGSSDYSAKLSAQLGLGFAFAAHFSELPPELPMLAYREQFTPSESLPRPIAILTVSVICADTDAEAERLSSSLLVSFARLRTGQKPLLLAPDDALTYEFSEAERAAVEAIAQLQIVGSPGKVKQRIAELVKRTAADEVMVATMVHGHAERLRSYQLLADAIGMK